MQALLDVVPPAEHAACALVRGLTGAIDCAGSAAPTKSKKAQAAAEALELQAGAFQELKDKEGEERLTIEIGLLSEIHEALLEHDDVRRPSSVSSYPCRLVYDQMCSLQARQRIILHSRHGSPGGCSAPLAW